MTREEQKIKRREQIISAALEVFLHKGFHAAKIKDIAKQVDMSTGLLFHYFKNKEEVYTELFRIGLTGPSFVMGIPAENPVAFFRTAAVLILKELEKNGDAAKMFAFMIQASISPATEQARALIASLDNIRSSVPYIESGQKQGLFKQGDPTALALAFWSAINGIALVHVISPQFALPDADWLVDILLKHS